MMRLWLHSCWIKIDSLNRSSIHVVGDVRERGEIKNALEKVSFVIRGGSLGY